MLPNVLQRHSLLGILSEISINMEFFESTKCPKNTPEKTNSWTHEKSFPFLKRKKPDIFNKNLHFWGGFQRLNFRGCKNTEAPCLTKTHKRTTGSKKQLQKSCQVFNSTWNAKRPIFQGNVDPKTSNYCLKKRTLGFPGITDVCFRIPFRILGTQWGSWCIDKKHGPWMILAVASYHSVELIRTH